MTTTEIRHSLDWLQTSAEWPDSVWEWPLENREAYPIVKTCVPYLDTTGWEPERDSDFRVLPMAGYKNTYDLLYASAHVDPNRREQKIGVRMTGQNLNAYRSLGGTEGRLLTFYKDLGAKTSRIDIAFDLFNYGIDPTIIYADWKARKIVSHARTVQPYTKAVLLPDGTITEASTLYWGSRESETMVRMYEKGKQMQSTLDWFRVELEIKGDRASAVTQDCERLGVAVVGKQLLRDYFQTVPYRFWRDLVEGQSTELTPVGRKKSAHDAWVQDIILPMLQHDIATEWESATESGTTRAVEALIREHWTCRALAIRKQYAMWSIDK